MRLSSFSPLRFVVLLAAACGGLNAGSPDAASLLDGGAQGALTPDAATTGSDASSNTPARDATTNGAGSNDASTNDAIAAGSTMGDASGSASDGGIADWDGSFPALLDRCMDARDVLYVEASGEGANVVDPARGPQRYTNLDATWAGFAGSLQVGATATTSFGVVGGGTVSVTTVPGIPLSTGTFAEPLNHSVPRPYLDLTLGDVALTADGYTSGSFFVGELGTDDAGTTLSVLAVAFDVTVPTAAGNARFVGCVHYAEDVLIPGSPETVLDAAPTMLDNVSGPGLFSPCANVGTSIYTERSGGYPGAQGLMQWTPGNASFNAGIIGSDLVINGQFRSSTWQLQAFPSAGGTLGPGMYTAMSAATGPFVQVSSPPDPGCGSPTGTFGIQSLVTDPSNPDDVTQAGVWFDLQCMGAGSLKGCVAFGQ